MPARTLLLIDDDEVDRKAVVRALRAAGSSCEVHEALDGKTGVEYALSGSFDCILVDYHLPDRNGLDVLTELRVRPEINAPLIMLTGEGSELIAVEAMKLGAHDYLPKALMGPDSLYRVIVNAIEKYSLQHKLAEAQRQLEHQALYDMLTGLGNRNLFARELNRAIANAVRKKEEFFLLFMDLNKFKEINDRYGHEAGDTVLTAVGQRFIAIARAEDAYFRLGGDEFSAIFHASDSEGLVETLCRRLIATTEAPIPYQDQRLEVGISIGIAIYPVDGMTSEALIHAADQAMYSAKRTGAGFVAAGDLTE